MFFKGYNLLWSTSDVMYEYIKEDDFEVDEATSEIDEIIAPADTNSEIDDADDGDIFDPIDAVFKVPPPHYAHATKATDEQLMKQKTTDEPVRTFPDPRQTDDKLFELIVSIAADVKEMKREIVDIKTYLNRTESNLTTKLNIVEEITNSMSQLLKRRKTTQPTAQPEPSTSAPSSVVQISTELTPVPSAVTNMEMTPASASIPQPKLTSTFDNTKEPVSFTSLISDSIFLDDTYPPNDDLLLSPNCQPLPTNQSQHELSQKKRKTNPCATFIRQQLQSLYQEEELAKSAMNGGKRKWKHTVTERSALSPHRFARVLQAARKKFTKEEIESLDMNGLVNSKCRQVRYKLEKRFKHLE